LGGTRGEESQSRHLKETGKFQGIGKRKRKVRKKKGDNTQLKH